MVNLEVTKVEIVATAKEMMTNGLVKGTAGNISCVLRNQGLMLITPSGVDYHQLLPEHISVVDLTGHHISGLTPSTETFMHLGIYTRRPDVHSVVHTHSPFATILSVLGMEVPAVHYMVAVLGGNSIPVTRSYQLFGTHELADEVVEALGDQLFGIIIRNHGVVAIGDKLSSALSRASVLEEMSSIYYHALAIGRPQVLTHGEMQEVRFKLGTYGLSNKLDTLN